MTTTTSPSTARAYAPMALTALAVLVVDQVSKLWANGDWIFDGLKKCSELAMPRPKATFCLAYNEGMAFSIGWGAGAFISVIAIVIVGVLVAFARKVSPMQRLVMGAIAGGAVGNVIDRAFRDAAPGTTDRGFMGGAVVDFFYSSFWATFNVADAAIVVGGILLAIAVYRMPEPTDDAEAAQSSSAPESDLSDEPTPERTVES